MLLRRADPMTLRRAAPILLLLFLISTWPTATSQETAEETVWDEPRVVTEFLTIANNTTLVIRGTTIQFEQGFRVDNGSRLILESLPGFPAVISAASGARYNALVMGTLEIRGLPESPAVIEGMSGTAQTQRQFIYVVGGLDIAGEMIGSHFEVRNYTAGIRLVLPAARVEVDHVLFASAEGVGLITGSGSARVSNATFVGKGATFWASTDQGFSLEDSRLGQSESPISVNDGRGALRNVTVAGNVTRCIKILAGNVSIDGMTCQGYAENGIQMEGQRSLLHAEDIRVSSGGPEAGATINAVGAGALEVRNSTLGPTAKNGVRLLTTEPVFEGVVFRDIGAYNVLLIDPLPLPPYALLGEGESGRSGWLSAIATASAQVLMPDLTPAPGAGVGYARESTGVLEEVQVANSMGQTPGIQLETFRIGPDGTAKAESYTVRAQDATGRFQWEREAYVPDGTGLTIRLVETIPEGRATPFFLLYALVAIAIAASLAPRRS